MKWSEVGRMRCSIARTLSVVGERWTLMILRDAFLGARRFDHFQASLRCSPHLLSTRLAKLVGEGLLETRAYSERPPRHEYRLTEKGRDLYPVIASLLRWGDRWMDDGSGPPVELEHRPCGHVIQPVLCCPACETAIDPREMRARLRAPEPD